MNDRLHFDSAATGNLALLMIWLNEWEEKHPGAKIVDIKFSSTNWLDKRHSLMEMHTAIVMSRMQEENGSP